MKFKQVWLLCIVLFCYASSSVANHIQGRVTKVSDGDTIWVLTENKQRIKIRLWGIDAPEKAQPWGRQSTKALRRRVQNQHVHVDVQTIDQYKRKVGIVYMQGEDMNQWLVANGHAWVYRYYNKDRYYEDEAYARKHQVGLWKLPKAECIPPWDWRRHSNK